MVSGWCLVVGGVLRFCCFLVLYGWRDIEGIPGMFLLLLLLLLTLLHVDCKRDYSSFMIRIAQSRSFRWLWTRLRRLYPLFQCIVLSGSMLSISERRTLQLGCIDKARTAIGRAGQEAQKRSLWHSEA